MRLEAAGNAMTESTPRSIPLQVLQGDAPSAPLQAGAKQLGGDKINRSPVQFADAVKEGLGLRTYLPPIDVPASDVNLYWHSRYDKDLTHQWMREQIFESVRALGFVLD